MFFQILNQVTEQTNRQCQGRKYVTDYLIHAISIWCERLNISQDITDNILKVTIQSEIQELTTYIYSEWQPKQEEERNWLGQVVKVKKTIRLYNLVLNIINVRKENVVKFLVLIAFVITAVGYWIYIINRQREQQTNRREEPRQYNSKPSSPTVQDPPAQKITKQFLVLVVFALQADFLESLGAKRRINSDDGESLYEVTKYLWLGSETELLQRTANINQYLVSKGQESEYDIYLVYIELNQADEGFKPNISQLDRYDAFRKLADLGVDLKVSPRLKMEAYENIEVYSR